MTEYVVDANVVTRFLLEEEPFLPQVDRLIQDYVDDKIKLSAPILFMFEVTDNIITAARGKRIKWCGAMSSDRSGSHAKE